MKSRNVVLLMASLVACANLWAQTVAEKPGAVEELLSEGDQLASQDQQAKKQAPADYVKYDQPPEVVKQVQPDYPDEAVASKTEGTVWVNIWIDESGKVVEGKIMKSSAEVFNQAALAAAKQWTFKPAVLNDKPVAVWVMVPFRFTLSGGVKSPPPPGVVVEPRETKVKSSPPDENAKVDQGPEPIKQMIPKYPADAKRDKIEGMVWTKLWVDEKGHVVKVTVTKSDNEVFNQAAIDAAKQWVFKPAIAKGQPVAVWVDLPFKFALK